MQINQKIIKKKLPKKQHHLFFNYVGGFNLKKKYLKIIPEIDFHFPLIISAIFFRI